jgi:nucleotide-binding universal stress UspA family protein
LIGEPTFALSPKERAMVPIRTILHPTDFSESSGYAFQLACALTRDYGARLVVVHVAEPPLPIYAEGAVLVPPAKTQTESATEKLHSMQAPAGDVRVEHRLLEGAADVEILRATEEIKADLIVMGTHGRTGLSRLVMGSVAESISRKAPCPVLTVRGPLRGLKEKPRPAISESEADVPKR